MILDVYAYLIDTASILNGVNMAGIANWVSDMLL